MPAARTLLLPHAKDLGAGFKVRRLLPAAARQAVGPFLFFDHFGPIDVQPADALVLSTRNLPGVRLVPANRVTARDVMDCAKVIASQAALTRLQEALA